MKDWVTRALALLDASVGTSPHELNELDWKSGLSPDKKRLAEHLSAFANFPGGGFFIFGVDASGVATGVNQQDLERCITQLSNLSRSALEPSIAIDHSVETYASVRLLVVYVPESPIKPVVLRGKSIDHAFIRSGGSTRAASRQEIGILLLQSRTPRWEDLHASTLLTDDGLVAQLDAMSILKLIERPVPADSEALVAWMSDEKLVDRHSAGGGYVTNLGAIAAARRLSDFPDLSRKAVRLIVYDGLNKSRTKHEQEGTRGYAIAFQGLLKYVGSLLPQSEVIEKALRVTRTLYPELALRELIANALIHQDFSLAGTGPLIEIFDNRVEISNPGGLLPSKQLDRLIGTQPESRNEQLARLFRRYKYCEERGSGLLKAGLEIELYGSPPIRFDAGSNFFKVTLFAPRTFAQMSERERLDASYQHAVLRFFSTSAMTNRSLRERLKMPEKQRSMVSVLIQEALDARLIKPAGRDNRSRKFAEYVPYWA